MPDYRTLSGDVIRVTEHDEQPCRHDSVEAADVGEIPVIRCCDCHTVLAEGAESVQAFIAALKLSRGEATAPGAGAWHESEDELDGAIAQEGAEHE